MSSKSTRRSRRRTDDEIEQDFKLPTIAITIPKKDTKTDVQENPKNGAEDDGGNLKGVTTKETQEESEPSDNSVGRTTRSRSNTPQNKKEPSKTNNGDASNDKDEKNGVEVEQQNENASEEKVATENGDKIESAGSEEAQNGNDDAKQMEEEPAGEAEVMEELVVDMDEPEPELEFADNSESESHKGSPYTSRCKTRRSQSRNIPTPKTPKSVVIDIAEELQTEHAVTDEPEEVRQQQEKETVCVEVEDDQERDVLAKPLAATPDDVPEAASSTEKSPEDEGDFDAITSTNVEDDSLVNFSTKVQIPSDETRNNTDLMSSEEQNDESNSFLNVAREKTFTEILRRTSCRRPIRSSVGLHRWTEIGSNNVMDRSRLSLRPSVERMAGLKRKCSNELSENIKRTRSDNNGFLSYISSPLTNLKSKFGKTDVSSSTPKLTGYKSKLFESDDVSKIDMDLDIGDPTSEKKWCLIM